MPTLEITPAKYTLDDNQGGGSTTVSFTVQISGLTADTAVAGYDLGIIYDPAIMVLSNFSGFTNADKFGDELNFDAYSEDHLGDVNSLWDYRDPSAATGLGAYEGPVLGTPDITGQGIINEGSLRFTQISFLDRAALLSLQDYTVNPVLVLFTLEFTVNTTGHKTGTPLLFVDDMAYANFGDPGTGSLLDVKLSTPTDPDAIEPNYLSKLNGSVRVPEPATLGLLLLGLGGARLARRRRAAVA